MFTSISEATGHIGGYTTEAVTPGHCDAGYLPSHFPLVSIHFPSRKGQEAELARVAGYIPRRYTRERSPVSVLTGLDVE